MRACILSTLRAAAVEFAWTRNPDAATYDFQLAAEPNFAAPLREQRGLGATRLELAGLAPGTYHWRLASVRSAGDRGPWGDPVLFVLGALPAAPAVAVANNSVRFAWTGEPGQSFEFQMARDRAFADVIVARTLAEPQLMLDRPGPGRYYIRYRARDADGFIGPFTSPQQFEVPRCVLGGSGNCIRASTGVLSPQ